MSEDTFNLTKEERLLREQNLERMRTEKSNSKAVRLQQAREEKVSSDFNSRMAKQGKMDAEKAGYISGKEKSGGFLGFGQEYAPGYKYEQQTPMDFSKTIAAQGAQNLNVDSAVNATMQAGASVAAKKGGEILAKEGAKELGKEAGKAGLGAAGSMGVGVAGKIGGDLIDKGGTSTDTASSVAGGTVKGITTGAAFGAPGMIIGGAIGGISGAMSAKSNRKAKAAKAAAKMHQDLGVIEGQKTERLNLALSGLADNFSKTLV